jgi:hypothetical protein
MGPGGPSTTWARSRYNYQWQPTSAGVFPMTTYTWNDSVTAKPGSDPRLRPGELASVVGIIEEKSRKGEFLEEFPHGTVYTIEFNDGSSVEAAEDDLLPWKT